MKRLLITCTLLIVIPSGVLHGNYVERKRAHDMAMNAAYKDIYIETLAFHPMTDYPL